MSALKAGDKAPHFEGIIQDESTVSLTDFKGKKLALFFYPKDNTPTCTNEACNLRDNYAALQAAGYEVLGISPDSARRHTNFIKKYDLPYDLIADTEKTMLEAYGVWAEKSMFGKKYMGVVRTTFLIDEEGTIKEIISKVKAKEHADQILTS